MTQQAKKTLAVGQLQLSQMARMTSVVRALFTLIISMMDWLVGMHRQHDNARQKN
ncbi:MAG: hypothetical protein IJ911_07705 [Salinivirgaceae bacterium]|nr:hypothetical protein [Salinivirgaceae bacterium]